MIQETPVFLIFSAEKNYDPILYYRLQDKLKQKRLEREEEERKEAIQREKQRRTFGKDVVASKEK